MARRVLGIDVRSDVVAVFGLRAGMRELTAETVRAVPVRNGDAAAALRAALEAAGFDGAVCSTAFPASGVSFRNLRLPFVHTGKIRQILPFELEPRLPLPVGEQVFDFFPLDFEDPAGEGKSRIVSVAARTASVETFLEMLGEAGLPPGRLSVGALAVAHCLAALPETPEQFLLIDSDGQYATLAAVAGKRVSLARNCRLPADPGARGARLAREAMWTLAAGRELLPFDFHPAALYLNGDPPGGEGLAESLRDALDLPVEAADLAGRMGLAPSVPDGHDRWAGSVGTALALAVAEARGLNPLDLRQGPFAARNFFSENRGRLARSAMLAALVLGLFLFDTVFATHRLQRRIDELDERITASFRTAFPEVRRIVDPLQQMRIRVAGVRKDRVLQIGGGGRSVLAVDILDEITRRVPAGADVELTRLTVDEDQVLLAGSTDTFNRVDELKNRLEEAPPFRQITITSSTKEKAGKRVLFKLKIQL